VIEWANLAATSDMRGKRSDLILEMTTSIIPHRLGESGILSTAGHD
jgi:hypothetical protein